MHPAPRHADSRQAPFWILASLALLSLLPGTVACTRQAPPAEVTASATQVPEAAAAPGRPVVLQAWLVESTSGPMDFPLEVVRSAALGDGSALIASLAPEAGAEIGLAQAVKAADKAGRLRTLAAPRTVTRAGETWSVQTGVQIPVQTRVGETVTIIFVDSTLSIQLVATEVGQDIDLEYRLAKRIPRPDLVPGVEKGPSAPLETLQLQGKAILADGGTAVIGGVYAELAGKKYESAPELTLLVTATFDRK